MFRNINLNEPTLKNKSFDEILNLPFVFEDLASEE